MSLDNSVFYKTAIIAEVSTENTRETLYEFFKTNNIKVFSQNQKFIKIKR